LRSHRDEHVDGTASALQQVAILDARPAETLNRRYLVAHELWNQIVWNVLVKQDAHWSARSRAPVREQQ
jgi:hypothetical protein